MPRPFIPAPNCASIELIYSANGVTCENVIHVSKGTPYSAADIIALRTIIDNWDNTSWKTIRHLSAILTRIRIKALDSVGSPMEDYSLPSPRVGTWPGTGLPNSVTVAVKLSTGLTGRSYRGRLYVVGVSTASYASDSNVLTATYAANLLTTLTALKTNLTTGGHTLGVLSYRTSGAWRATGLFVPATGWVMVDNNIDSQSRRLRGRGI